MVVIALAGGSGGVGREIVDGLLARDKHDITILTRQDPATQDQIPGIRWVQVDYTQKASLVAALRDVHTVLSFIVVQQDRGNTAQRTLIDACVEAGVKRFAPSEWAGSSPSCLPWYAGKDAIYQYLTALNREHKVLEFCCFRPGLLMNYLACPKTTTKHVGLWGIHIDMHQKRAITLKDAANPGYLVLTTMEDVVEIVVRAVEYEGEWPQIGGICGDKKSVADIIGLGERIRGPFTTEEITTRQARAGRLTTSWCPPLDHSMVPEQMRSTIARTFTAKNILAIHEGSWIVGDEWNRLLPDYQFTKLDEFLQQTWQESWSKQLDN